MPIDLYGSVGYSIMVNDTNPTMFTQEDHEFIDFLFGKLVTETDTDMIDLHDDDSCCDHIEFKQLELDT